MEGLVETEGQNTCRALHMEAKATVPDTIVVEYESVFALEMG